MPRASAASTAAMNSAPGSEPPWRLRSETVAALAITASASATHTATATSSAAGRDVVRARGVRAIDLLARVRGQADQHVRPDQLARLCHGHVLLAHVNSVGACLTRDEGTVVDDQQRADALAKGAHRFRDRHQL